MYLVSKERNDHLLSSSDSCHLTTTQGMLKLEGTLKIRFNSSILYMRNRGQEV